jgi:lipopolysaccharide heptosyltransferase II
LEGNPALHRILAVHLSLGGWWAAIRAVRAGQFDLVIDLQGLFRSAVLGWLSGAPVRVGFANGREGSSWFYTHKVVVVDPRMHAVDRYLLVSRSFGGTPPPTGALDFPLAVDSEADQKLSDMLLSAGAIAGSPLVAINAGARWSTKQWAPRAFAEVADNLQDEGLRVVMVGSAAEGHPARAVVGHMRTSPINLVGKTSLKELIALLRRVSLLITNDSGPMHVAAALGTPVVALFGPTDPGRTGPYGLGHRVLRSGIPCSPCFSRRCVNPKALECLTLISPGQVLQEALEILRKAGNSSVASVAP